MPGIPENITIAGRTPATIKGNLPPLIDTAEAARGGFRAGDSTTATLLFAEDFNDQPEWTGSQSLAAASVTDWYKHRNGEVMFAAHDAVQITGSIPAALKSGSDKSLVVWRESYKYPDPDNTGSSGPANNFYSDGQLDYYFGEGNGETELFVRYFVKFQPGWTAQKFMKMFRIMSWDENDPNEFYSFFTGGNSAPIFLQAYSAGGQYGLRNFLAFRSDPQETDYFTPELDGLPAGRSMNSGDVSLNFDGDMRRLDGRSSELNPITLIDRTTGSEIQPGTITFDQVYGDEWNKVEFHIKMNSAPGVNDGVLTQWVNDQLCFANSDIPWMAAGSPGDKKWNVVGFGGNGQFFSYPNTDEVEEWFAFAEIEIWNGLPEEMK